MLVWSENENFNFMLPISNSLGTLFKNTKNDFCLPQFDHQSKVNPKKKMTRKLEGQISPLTTA